MKDRYDIFGGLLDTIENDWIESEEKLEKMMDEYIHLRKQARSPPDRQIGWAGRSRSAT